MSSASHVQTGPPAAQRTAFERFAGHLRIMGTAVVLTAKLGILGALAIAWMTAAGALRYANFSGGIFLLTLTLGFWTVYLAMSITRRWERWWIAPPLSLVLAFTWFAFWLWFDRLEQDLWQMRLEGIRETTLPMLLKSCVPPVLVGGFVGLGWFICSTRALCAWRVDGAFRGAFATFGTQSDGDYRPQIDALLAHAESAFAAFLMGARGIALSAAAVLLVALAGSWLADATNQASADLMDVKEVAIWSAIGVVLGGALGLVLIPAGRLRTTLGLAAMFSAAGLTCVPFTLLFAHQLSLPRTVIPRLAIVTGFGAIAAAFSAAVVQFVTVFIIRAVMPAPIQQHLLGGALASPPAAATPSGGSAQCCEQCGYHLDGLPTITCERCGVVELRCPECGHAQPAGTMHARMIHRQCRSHFGVRIGSWLLALVVAFVVLMPVFFIGMAVGRSSFFGSRVAVQEWIGLFLLFTLLIAPLRFMLMHWRPWFLGALLSIALPTMAAALGAAAGRSAGPAVSEIFTVLVPMWGVAALLVPFAWRGWLGLMLPRRAASGAYEWHKSGAFRWPGKEGTRSPAQDVGAEIRVSCGNCGADIGGSPWIACAQCGVLSAICVSCATRKPVSMARAAFESLVRRARAMLLVQVCAAALLACLIGGLTTMVSLFSTYRPLLYGDTARPSVWMMILSAWVPVAITGSIVGVVLMNRGRVAAAVCSLAYFEIWAISQMALMRDSYSSRPEQHSMFMVVCGMLGATAFISGLLAPLALELAGRLLLPKQNASALFSWLSGQSSLDEAGASLG